LSSEIQESFRVVECCNDVLLAFHLPELKGPFLLTALLTSCSNQVHERLVRMFHLRSYEPNFDDDIYAC